MVACRPAKFLAGILLIHAAALAQGGMFVTGHMLDMLHFADLHILQGPGFRSQFTAALDFLVFGKAAAPDQVAKRGATRIAYLSQLPVTNPKAFDFQSGYPEPRQFYLQDAGWQRTLDSGAYDVVILGYPSSGASGHDALVGERRRIEAFINQGGKLLVLGQVEFGYLPRFTSQPPNGFTAKVFRATPKGDSIGWRTPYPDDNPRGGTQTFPDLDTTVFRVFEIARGDVPDSPFLPVSIGFQGRIEDTIFVPVDTPRVNTPRSSRPSGAFRDSLCAVFSTPTDSAALRYTLDGSDPARSPLTLPNGGRLCFDATTTIRLLGRRPGWKDSRDTAFTFTLEPLPLPSALSLFSDGRELSEVTFADTLLEIRLTRPAGLPCPGCRAQVTPSAGADEESLPLAARGAASAAVFAAGFARAETTSARPGDGVLQHGPADSLVFVWVNPDDPRDRLRRSYPYRPRPPYVPKAPELALFHLGREITAVEAGFRELEIRLMLDTLQTYLVCVVEVLPSGSADSLSVVLADSGPGFAGTFRRDLAPALRGDGVLQHGRQDSLILLYRDPGDPARATRRSYPFVPPRDTAALRPHNTVARIGSGPAAPGPQWILSDAPGLAPEDLAGRDGCCAPVAATLDAAHPDSARVVGFVIEASRAFAVEASVFTNLGELVSRAGFTLPESEFRKLAAVAGRETRSLRLLWTGRSLDGARVGTGAYVFKAAVRLLPVSGEAGAAAGGSRTWTAGVLRTSD